MRESVCVRACVRVYEKESVGDIGRVCLCAFVCVFVFFGKRERETGKVSI